MPPYRIGQYLEGCGVGRGHYKHSDSNATPALAYTTSISWIAIPLYFHVRCRRRRQRRRRRAVLYATDQPLPVLSKCNPWRARTSLTIWTVARDSGMIQHQLPRSSVTVKFHGRRRSCFNLVMSYSSRLSTPITSRLWVNSAVHPFWVAAESSTSFIWLR